MAAQGPLVRGICPAGHVVETRAPARRVTWRGPCPHELPTGGTCGFHVVAKRVTEPPPPPGPLEPAPPAAGAAGPPVRKVAAYRDHGLDPARPDEPGFAEPAPPEPGPPGQLGAALDGGQSGVPGSEGPGPGSPGPGRDPDPGPGRGGGRLAAWSRRLRAPGIDVDGDESQWTIPGIYP